MTDVLLFAVCCLLFEVTAAAQPLTIKSDHGAYSIPYASEGNRIELEVVNSTDVALEEVAVQVGAIPAWVTLEASSATIGALKPGESTFVTFAFNLDERAPVGDVGELMFEVVAGAQDGMPHPAEAGTRDDGQSLLETRTITIQPEAPTELTLRGNYPNPFNPTTKIAYALPKDGNVEIEVFNAIGQRVTRLVDRIQTAGYQDATWNAAGHPSGVYFYAVTLDVERARQVKVGRMVVLK